MYYAFAVLAALIVIGVVVVYVLRNQTGFVQRRVQVDEELESDTTPTLAYDVPTGEDPTVILAALELAGYTATVEPRHPFQRVLIAYVGDRDAARERIRPVIESAGVSTAHDHAPVHTRTVRFTDE
jgi:hypothetical protein